MPKPKRNLRQMRQAAMGGNTNAAKALLRVYGFGALAAEIRPNKPWPPRVARQVRALTAGTGESDGPGEWERVNETTGEIESLLHHDPPRVVRPRPMFED
jgi:hypothetical protein